jgi:flagellar hook-associated protein 1 FlgK
MSGLLSSLQSAGNVLRDFEKAVGVVQNNVVNAATPGYARQDIQFSAIPFQPEAGWFGGVQVSGLQHARSQYAEQSVRQEAQQQGYYAEKSAVLRGVESAFSLTGGNSLSDSINNLFAAFSAWSESANDTTQRLNVLAAADQMASSFRQTAADLSKTADAAIEQIGVQVDKINQLAARIAELNHSALVSPHGAAATDTEMYACLEELSESVNFTAIQAADGTVTVMLGGQTPLVIGDNSYAVKMERAAVGTGNARPEARIVNAAGDDVTALVQSGRLGGLLSVHNEDIAALLGSATARGSLNDLAYALATRVNEILASGQVDDPEPPAVPVAGQPIFLVSADSTAAATLSIDPAIGAGDLAAIDPGPPKVANGIALRLAALARPVDAADKLSGQSFSDFQAGIVASVGRSSASAQTGYAHQAQLLSQARSIRSEISGVSLDQEATRLIEFQRSYEATARVVTVVNELMESLVNLIR